MSFNPFIQSGTRSQNYAVSTGSATITGVTAGSLLIFEFHWLQDGGTATPPTAASGWTQATATTGITCTANGSYRNGCSIWYKENASAGTTSVTMTPAAGTGGACVLVGQIHEFGTGVTSSSLDKVANSTNGTASLAAASGTTAATAQANEMVFAMMSTPGLSGASNTGVSDPPSGGYTSLNRSVSAVSSISGDSGFLVLAATGAQSTSWTWSTPSGEYSAAIATFKTNPPAAATLSLPTATSSAPTTVLGGVTTTVASGTLYAVVDTAANLSGVTAAQIIAGQKANSTAALAANSATATTTTPSVTVSGLTASTLYTIAFAQVTVGGNSGVQTTTFTSHAPVPNITSITPNPALESGAVTVAGTTFNTPQGAGTLTFADTVGGTAAQTVGTWTDTSLAVTSMALGTNVYGAATAIVHNNAGDNSSAFSFSLGPPTGWQYVVATTPDATSSHRLTATADIVAGDQIAWGNIAGTGTVTINSDGTFVADPGVSAFTVKIGVLGSGYGAPAVQTLLTSMVANLSAAGSGSIGVTTANALVTSDTGGGTMYVVATTNNLQPSNTNIKAGKNSFSIAVPNANQAAISGVNTLGLTGLTGATTYYLWFLQNTLGGDSTVVSASFVTAALPPAPTLTNPGTVNTHTTTARVKVTTDTTGGIVYAAACINTAQPTAAQIVAGQDATGTTVPSGSIAGVAGLVMIDLSGLSSGTAYRVFYVHELPGPVDSNIVHNNIATTATTPVLSAPGSDTVTNTTAFADVTTDTAGGTLYVVATLTSASPTSTQIKQGQDSTGTLVPSTTTVPTSGANSLPLIGLTQNTTYYLWFVQNNASGDSNIVPLSPTTVSFTTTNVVQAAVLSAPNATNITNVSASANATSDTAGGPLYVVATLTNTAPNAMQIIAGLNAQNNPVPAGNVVAIVGANSIPLTGLTTATPYYLWFVQYTGINSNIVTVSFVTTAPPPPPPPPPPSAPTYPTSGTVGQSRIQVIRYIEHAVRRCGALPNILSAEQLIFARENLGFILTDFSTKGLTAWTFEKQVQGLSVGQVRYPLANGTFQTINVLRRNATYNPVTVVTSTCSLVNTDTIAIYSTDLLLTSGGYFDFILELSYDGVTYYQAGRQTTFFVAGDRVCVESEITNKATYWRLRENTNSATFGEGFFLSAVTEVPMGQLNRSDYTNLPDKGQLTTDPTTYFLDKKTDTIDIVLWQAPSTSFRQIVAWVQRYVQDVGDFTEYLELPQRWQDAVIFELATRIFLELPKSVTDNLDPNRLQYLEGKALAKLTEALSGESDGAPLRLTPRIAPYTRS